MTSTVGSASRGPAVTVIGGFDSTYLPGHGLDLTQTTGHTGREGEDLEFVVGAGAAVVRYPVRWQHVEREPGRYDWASTDAVLEGLRERGVDVVLDLLHHTSYPEWLADGFRDRRFRGAYVDFAVAVAERYPWLTSYTLVNEPFATLFLAGHEALWPPYDRGMAGFVRLLRNVLPAVAEASVAFSELVPRARHVWVDTAEHHAGTGRQAAYAAFANDRRHLVLDLALGRDLDASGEDRPALAALLAAGGGELLGLPPLRVDVLGLDYYCHSEWWYDDAGSHAPSPHPVGFAEVARQYWQRYDLPVALTETNLRGQPTDRVSWLKYMLEQYEQAGRWGVPLRGFCWYPTVDSCDWDSLLARAAGRVDPVGVLTVAPDRSRVETAFSVAWRDIAAGGTSATLPAYRFQHPCADQLRGYLAGLDHWDWQDPPAGQVVAPQVLRLAPTDVPDNAPSHGGEVTPPTQPPAPSAADLVVFSHLRWTWVWQRPQHLVTRFASSRAREGARTWFVEEPVAGDVSAPRLCTEDAGDVTRVWLEVPRVLGEGPHGFDVPEAAGYGGMVADLLVEQGRPAHPDVLVYTALALDAAHDVAPGQLIADVMDDLTAFADASPRLVLQHHRMLAEADVVFTGGRSLHRAVMRHRTGDTHLFPSGVETTHYASSRALRRSGPRRVTGYVGVLDERLDLDLLGGLAAALPDWTVRLVGPIAKIDPDSLPHGPNLEYHGLVSYDELPRVMAGFDVALMPFALNDATRSISPTKTLEYLAAGLPVVSTRVRDVVEEFSQLVHLADDAAGFAAACRRALSEDAAGRDHRLQPILRRREWDWIAGSMQRIVTGEPDTSLGRGAGAAVVA